MQDLDEETKQKLPVCFFQPAGNIAPPGWRWAMALMAVALLFFSIAVVAMAIAVNNYAGSLRECKTELDGLKNVILADQINKGRSLEQILNQQANTLGQIQHHKEISLENRIIQSRVENLINGLINEKKKR